MTMAIHLVVKNDGKTIKKTLESLLPLNAQIYISDIGSTDDTNLICRSFGAKIKRRFLTDDYSEVRNAAIAETEEDWIFVLDTWEIILTGHTALLDLTSPASYRLSIVRGDIITREVRLWHRSLSLRFINPVYETVIDDMAQDLPVYLSSMGGRKDHKELVTKWKKKKPLATEPIYYESCTLLIEKKWDSFLNMANHYIFTEKKPQMSLTMIRYYCGMVYCHIKKNYQKALEYLLPCIADKPTMAEFWCLLGDIYYATHEYEKAKSFYENAIILGSRRLKNDDWPFEITKYKEYPNRMIEGCNQVICSSKYYGRAD